MSGAERQLRYRKLAKKRRRARNFEWFTPPGIIALAVEAMGAIDLDPASCALANETVGAKVFHSLDDDGLKQDWHGRIWLDPPYSNIASFIDKLIAEATAGRVTEFIVLSSNASDARSTTSAQPSSKNWRQAEQMPLHFFEASPLRLKNRLDFCRKGRIAMGAGRWTWPPGETLRARPATCGALGRASVNSGAANQRSPNDVDPFHKIPEHEERRT